MEIFKLRNLALGCFAFLLSIYVSNILHNLARIIIISCLTVLLILFFIAYMVGKNDKILKITIRYTPLVLGIIIALFISIFTFGNDEKAEDYFGESYETILEIKEIKYEEIYDSLYIAETKNIDGKDYKTKIYFSTSGGYLQEGDIIKAKIRYTELIYYGPDEQESIFTKGIRASGICSDEGYKIIDHNDNKVNIALNKIREFLKEQIRYGVNDETYEIICAVLLGDKSSLSNEVSRDFSRTGTSHILALSGIHIALIVTLIGFMLSLAHIPQKLKILIIIFSTSFFMLLTGMSKSAMRAGIMVIIFNFLLMLRYKIDTITSLFLAVGIICLLSPYSAFSISLMLSFIALLALIVSGKFIYSIKFLRRLHPRPLRYVVFTLISTTAVNIFTLPIMFLYFGTVSLVSPFMNIIIVPVFTVILYLSPFIIAFSKIAFLRVPIGFVLEKLVHVSLFIIHNVAKLKYVVIPISGTIEAVGIVLLVFSIFLVIIISRKRVKFAILGIALSLLVFASGVVFTYVRRFNEVAFSASMQKNEDFITIEYDNKLTVISIGTNSHLVTSYYLSKDLDYTEIENLIILEYDKYLANRVCTLSELTYLRNLYLLYPSNENENEFFEQVKTVANDKNIAIHFIENNMNFGEISLDVSIKTLPRSTKHIICISALANNSRLTYLGASSFELLDGTAENMAYASDIVIFGSYGPSYSTEYSYKMPYLDYCIFLGGSRNFAKDDFIASLLDKELECDDMIRFIFK